MVRKQMELPAIPRKRVRLGDAVNSGEPMTLGEEVEVDLRLPTRIARAVLADPQGAVGALKAAARELDPGPALDAVQALVVDVEAFIGYTPWETQKAPPCAGWWEVTPHHADVPPKRMWFSGTSWAPPGGSVAHELFRKIYAWRGLRAQHPALARPRVRL